MSETWKAIPGYEGWYEVSDIGNVRSLDRFVKVRNHQRFSAGRVLAVRLSFGYPRVALCRDGKMRLICVHTLVLLAFVGPRPKDMEACHNDDVKTNNRVSNLRWDTKSANARDRVRNGNDAQARLTHCPSGHVYDEANTYVVKSGWRRCRTCHRIKVAAAARRARLDAA